MIVDDGADLTRTVHERFPHLLAGKYCWLQLAAAKMPHEYHYFHRGGGGGVCWHSKVGGAQQYRLGVIHGVHSFYD